MAVLVAAAVVPGTFNPNPSVPRLDVPVEGAPTANRRQHSEFAQPIKYSPPLKSSTPPVHHTPPGLYLY